MFRVTKSTSRNFGVLMSYLLLTTGSARWEDKKDGGWNEWKHQQGNLGPDHEDYTDPEMAMQKFSPVSSLPLPLPPRSEAIHRFQ